MGTFHLLAWAAEVLKEGSPHIGIEEEDPKRAKIYCINYVGGCIIFKAFRMLATFIQSIVRDFDALFSGSIITCPL